MAPGFAYNGGVPRCFAYWQEFSKCYANAENPSQCRPQNDDYLECLHRTKETFRSAVVDHEYKRQLEHVSKEGKKAAEISSGNTGGVGLIQRNPDESK